LTKEEDTRNNESIRKEDIQEIFQNTIWSMDKITKEYDYCFSRLKDHERSNKLNINYYEQIKHHN
jgi:hypothetical protein